MRAMATRSQLVAFALLAPLALIFLVFFIGPLIWNFQESLRFRNDPLSIGQYARIFTDGYYLTVLTHTLLLGLVVTVLSLVLGYPLAIAVARSTGWWKSALMFIIVAPLLINVVVRSYGWMVILGGSGVINAILKGFGLPKLELMYNWAAITVALVHVLLPFMVLAIAGTIEMIDRTLEEAATQLGAPPRQVFRHVILPLSLDGVITGSVLVFTLTVGSFVTVMLLGDTGTAVLPLLIYQQLVVVSDWPFAGAMGTVLLVIVTAVLWLQGRRLSSTTA
jgi:ABC-type spermidine/putrescine transport system permease subunit I